MRLCNALDSLADLPRPESLDHFQQDIPTEWVEEALCATGTATVRRRRLPADQVIWLVVGMALMRDSSIKEVVSSLDLAMPERDRPEVAPSAISQARGRVGESPLQWLFTRCASEWAEQSARRDTWRGLALFGLDGSTFRVPDSDANRAYFGLANGGHRGESGYPLVRLVALMALRSHQLMLADFGPYENGEYTYAQDLWPAIPDDSLTIVDKNFFSAQVLLTLWREGRNRHWLLPAKKGRSWQRIERLGEGDEIVEMKVSREARRRDPTLPATWQVRAIRRQVKGFRPMTLLTSLTDAKRYPAREIASLYHERWELELGYDEIKTEMLDQTHTPLRSKSPEMVSQELWGVLIAYNLIRLEMERIADEARVPPTRISFTMVYNQICAEWLVCANASPGAIPRRLQQLRQKVKRYVIPERRRRSYSRAVKVKMSNYPKKRR